MARANFLSEIEALEAGNDANPALHRDHAIGKMELAQEVVDDAASESQFVEVKVELLSGDVVLDNLKLPVSTSIFDLKNEIEQRDGTPAKRQQLVSRDCTVLDDKSTLKELGFVKHVTLGLIRRASLQFIWDMSAHFDTTPLCVCSDSFQVGNDEKQSVAVEYYPSGCESRLRKQGMCSVFLTRPRSSVLHCRISIGRWSRENFFTSAIGQTGWTNFCEIPEEQPMELVLEVMHLGIVEQPVVDSESASWDLRCALGGMPFAVGQQIKSQTIAFGDVQIQLVFFPGGKSNAPAYHTSLWVMPIQNLFDRQYRCTVDGCIKTGKGESWLHFPRPEQFGNIHIQLLDETSSRHITSVTPVRPYSAYAQQAEVE